MKSYKVNLEDFGDAIIEIIGEAIHQKEAKVDILVDEYAIKIKDEIKDNTRLQEIERTGKYKSGWTVSKELINGKYVYIVHNKNKPKLTHIFENGTEARYTKKTKQYRGQIALQKFVHIRPAVDRLLPEFKEKLKQI